MYSTPYVLLTRGDNHIEKVRNRNYCYRSSLLDTGATCATLYEETTKGRTSEESRQQTADSRKQKAVYIQAYVQEYIQTDFKPTDHFTRQPELYAFVFPKMTVFIHSINFPIHQSISHHDIHSSCTKLTSLNLPTRQPLNTSPPSSPSPSPSPSPFQPQPQPHLHSHLPQISIPISSLTSSISSLHLHLPHLPRPSSPSPKKKQTNQNKVTFPPYFIYTPLYPIHHHQFLYPIRPSTILHPRTSPPHHRHHPATSSSPRLNVMVVMIIHRYQTELFTFYLLSVKAKGEKRKIRKLEFKGSTLEGMWYDG